MAEDSDITSLPTLSNAVASDVLPIVDVASNTTKKISKIDLFASMGPIGGGIADTSKFTEVTADVVITDSYGTSIEWNDSYNSVNSFSAKWDDASSIVQSSSAAWETAVGAYLPLSGGTVTGQTNIQNVLSSTDVIYAAGGDSNLWNVTYTTVNTTSAKWDDTSSIVQTNSASWNPSGLYFLPLSGGTVIGQTNVENVLSSTDVIYASGGNSNLWNAVYNSVNTVSAKWDDTSSKVQSNSAKWDDTSSKVQSNSAKWDDTSSKVQSNSAKWDDTSSKVQSNSAKWDDTSSKVQSNSAKWNPSGIYFLPLSGGTVIGQTNIQNVLSSNNIIYANSGNSNLWSSVYNSVNTASAKWDDTSSKVQSNSASWNPSGIYFLPLSGGTVTGQTNIQNILSSNNVIYANSGNSNLWSSSYTTVNTASAKWDDTSSKVQSNSAKWDDTSSKVQSNSAKWDDTSSKVQTNSAKWDDTSSKVQSNSAKWNPSGIYFLPLSGGTVTGQTNVQNVLSSTNIIYANSGNSNLWSSVYNSVNTASAKWDDTSSKVQSNSAKWDDTSSKVQSNSASWNPSGIYFLPLSGGTVIGQTNIQNVLSSNNIIYANNGNSNLWNSSYTTVNTSSASWGTSTGVTNPIPLISAFFY